jgi:protoporphyrinogen oxidase
MTQPPNKNSSSASRAVIIGAGPAGLTAAYQLLGTAVHPVVFEKDDIVGGISRTVRYKGYKFDIGGHRFFTKVKVVEDMWHEVMQEDFLLRSRSSRILYRGKYFHYPMRPMNALLGLGFWNSFLVGLSYLKTLASPVWPERTFQDWVSNRFGRRLFNIFF